MAARRLRIAVWHNLPSGGAKRALFDHVRGLTERGHFVEAWCPPQADKTFLPLSDLVKEHVVPLDLEPSALERSVARLWGRSFQPDIVGALDDHCTRVAAEIGAEFDVVYAASCQFVAVAPLGRATRLPSVLYVQEPNRRLYEASFRPDFALEDQPALPWLGSPQVLAQARRLANAERESAAAYTRILVNSRYSAESVQRAYALPSRVCYLGVDTDHFSPPSAPTRDYVVGLGAFVPEKRVELALDVCAQLDAKPRLVWVGNHVYSDAYMQRLVKRAEDRGVAFSPHTRVSDEELISLVGNARGMIYAPRLEPFGYAPLEANACGVPVVGGAEGGVRESIIDGVNGRLVEGVPEQLAAALDELWRDPTLAEELGRRARDHVVAHWSLDAAIDRLEAHLVDTQG